MTIIDPRLEEYVARHCAPESELLKELVQVTREKTELPQMQVGRIEGSVLRILTRSIRAKRVLEVGTFTGYSALCFAEAVGEEGEVHTCDIDPVATGIAQDFWRRSPVGGRIQLHLGPATRTIPELEGEFDLAFIDADKESYPAYWDLIAPRIRPGGMILMDNVLWGGSVLDSNPDAETKAIQQASMKAASDARFETTLLSVRDGLLVALRR